MSKKAFRTRAGTLVEMVRSSTSGELTFSTTGASPTQFTVQLTTALHATNPELDVLEDMSADPRDPRIVNQIMFESSGVAVWTAADQTLLNALQERRQDYMRKTTNRLEPFVSLAGVDGASARRVLASIVENADQIVSVLTPASK